MSDPSVSTVTGRRVEGGAPWLHVFGLVLLGGLLVLLISLPGVANEDQQAGPGTWFYCALALIVTGLASRIYALLRRSAFSRARALLIAALAIPTSYVLAIAMFFGIAAALS